jgi:hypothetical protein
VPGLLPLAIEPLPEPISRRRHEEAISLELLLAATILMAALAFLVRL